MQWWKYILFHTNNKNNIEWLFSPVTLLKEGEGMREQTGSEKERVCVKQREHVNNRKKGEINSMNFPLFHVYTKQTQTLVIEVVVVILPDC